MCVSHDHEQQNGWGSHTCKEHCIFKRVYNAARQGMRACNNTNMRNPPSLLWLRMLVLLHALISCLAAYILHSSPVSLHIYCTCFSTFWHCHPYILQHLMEMLLLPLYLVSGYACYYCCMPSSSVLLHIYCPCFSNFWHCYSYILQHFNRNVFTLL